MKSAFDYCGEFYEQSVEQNHTQAGFCFLSEGSKWCDKLNGMLTSLRLQCPFMYITREVQFKSQTDI